MEVKRLEDYYTGGPGTWTEAFPPVCIKSHWDPTAVTQYVLPSPNTMHDQSLDPRPSTRICSRYYSLNQAPVRNNLEMENAAPLDIPAALLGMQGRKDTDDIFPPGGAAGKSAPYHIYADNIGDESSLFRLNMPLSKCKERRYLPPGGPPVATNVVPNADLSANTMLSPMALEVAKSAGCREADDKDAWNRSSRLFFNPTKYDRYREGRNITGRNVLACPISN